MLGFGFGRTFALFQEYSLVEGILYVFGARLACWIFAELIEDTVKHIGVHYFSNLSIPPCKTHSKRELGQSLSIVFALTSSVLFPGIFFAFRDHQN